MKKLLTIAATLLITLSIHAETPQPKHKTARIDVTSGSIMKPGKGCHNPGWIKDETQRKKFICSGSKKLSDTEWIDYELQFTPESDGTAKIYLRGMYYRPKGAEKNLPVWVCYDEVEVIGADGNIINGSFEEVDEKGNAKGWHGKKYLLPEGGSEGKNCVKAWHNQPVVQTIKVKKGQPVTIKAKTKALK